MELHHPVYSFIQKLKHLKHLAALQALKHRLVADLSRRMPMFEKAPAKMRFVVEIDTETVTHVTLRFPHLNLFNLCSHSPLSSRCYQKENQAEPGNLEISQFYSKSL